MYFRDYYQEGWDAYEAGHSNIAPKSVPEHEIGDWELGYNDAVYHQQVLDEDED
jgi:hypothetical protein